ncbi:hypothetical protein AB0J72_40325 [Dactylosporangium sp. NPDC049742]|uniref:hypothetical protein n=1 Tax=Dactylosporangium sp. NPDC049742 TaxID=3154737 RepID=UPI00343B65A7
MIVRSRPAEKPGRTVPADRYEQPGIAAFLPRPERILETGLSVPTVDRRDNWYAVPDARRLSAR